MPEYSTYTHAVIPTLYSGKTALSGGGRSPEQKAREDHSSGKPDETGNDEQAIEELSDLSAGHRMHRTPPHHTYPDARIRQV